jgi:phospholipase/carboxylesterase
MSISRIPPVVLALAALAATSSACNRRDPPAKEERQTPPPKEEHQDPPAKDEHRGQQHAGKHPGEPAHTGGPTHHEDGTHTLAGLRYIEMVTGGASESDTLPLIAFFHGHGGKPEGFKPKFATFKDKARVILPYGLHAAENGNYEWFPGHSFKPEGQAMYAKALPAVENEVAAALVAIAKERPTVGKPIAGGFSQGAGLTLALALRHPDLLAAGCPMAGEVPAQTFEGLKPPATKPDLHEFIGDADPNEHSAKRTIEAFKALGYVADLEVLPGFGHVFGPGEEEVFGCLERAVRRVEK